MIKIIINGSLIDSAERPETYTRFNVLEMANKNTNDSEYEIKFRLLNNQKLLADGLLVTTNDEFNTEEWFNNYSPLELDFTITKRDTNS